MNRRKAESRYSCFNFLGISPRRKVYFPARLEERMVKLVGQEGERRLDRVKTIQTMVSLLMSVTRAKLMAEWRIIVNLQQR